MSQKDSTAYGRMAGGYGTPTPAAAAANHAQFDKWFLALKNLFAEEEQPKTEELKKRSAGQ